MQYLIFPATDDMLSIGTFEIWVTAKSRCHSWNIFSNETVMWYISFWPWSLQLFVFSSIIFFQMCCMISKITRYALIATFADARLTCLPQLRC